MSYLKDSTTQGRFILTDLVRAFALIGIVLVNVAYFAYILRGQCTIPV